MNPEALCAAVQSAAYWLERFTRKGYANAFKEYTEKYSPAFLEAVAETAGDEAAIGALAENVLDSLEAGWQSHRRWNRSAVRVNEKQVIVDYLSPMLLGLEEPLCQTLAKELRRRWEERWPKDVYHITTYTAIQSGFRNAIMGFDLENKHIDPAKDD